MALRLARRDATRHRGRAVLVMLLVGIPVLLICAGATAIATSDVSSTEAIPRVMGQAQARVEIPMSPGHRIIQGPDARDYQTGGRAKHSAGFGRHDPWTAQRVQHLTGGTVLPTSTAVVGVRTGDETLSAEALLVDGRAPTARGMAELTSGRWPHDTDEVLVTPRGIENGLPDHGSAQIATRQGKPVTVQVVGVGTAWTSDSAQADLVALPAATQTWQTDTDREAFLVVRQDPVTWPQVKRLNAYGLAVSSRQVIEHPAAAEADPASQQLGGDGNGAVLGIAVLLVVGIMLETVLLAGPAFAVSAARRRRSLALIASNGADRAQIRRCVLAQAVLLGALSAVLGALLGIGAGLLALRWWDKTDYGVNAPGPIDIPVWELLGVVACATLASLVAAWVPGRAATRLDLVGVLRGHGLTQHPVRAGMPLLGAALAGVGGVVLVMAVVNHGHEAQIALGAVVLVVGALLLIPWLLSGVARLGRRLPLPLRMAGRDLGRQRGRSAPAVAAIMVAVTSLTALAIANASDQEQARQDYQPTAVMGEGLITGNPGEMKAAADLVSEKAPDLQVMPVRQVGVSGWVGPFDTGPSSRAGHDTTVVRVQKDSCSQSSPSHHERALVVKGFGPVARCSALGSDRYTRRAIIGVVSVADARNCLHLSDSQIDTLAGGMLVARGRKAVHDGGVTVLTGTRRIGDFGEPRGRLTPHGVSRLPAASIDAATLDRFGRLGSVGALVTPATASAQGWPVFTSGLSLRSPSGMVPDEVEETLNHELPRDMRVYVERGYQGYLVLLYAVLFGVFGLLVLVATLVSTALAQAESRADLATLAAIGATRRLRRTLAGSQAFTIALVGSLLGLALGFVPGIALTWPLTAQPSGTYYPTTGDTTTYRGSPEAPSPVIDIPWAALGIVAIGIPLLAALMAAIAIRTSPQVTRRTT